MARVDSATGLKSAYSFDHLVVGQNNHVAAAACQEIVKAPGEMYNPLVIYGPAGVGKTHLMQAVAHEMLAQDPTRKVKYISAERFMNEIVTAIAEDRVVDLRMAYSQLDLLIIDDVQYLVESKIAQEELFHIFNNMHQENRQVILAADRTPNQLSSLSKGIRSRLEWGLATDVQPPDEATRLEILRRKQSEQGMAMADEMLRPVARALHSNVRELEGFLKRMHAYVNLSHQSLSMELVRAVVHELAPDAPDFIANGAALTNESPGLSAAPGVAPDLTRMLKSENGHKNGNGKAEPPKSAEPIDEKPEKPAARPAEKVKAAEAPEPIVKKEEVVVPEIPAPVSKKSSKVEKVEKVDKTADTAPAPVEVPVLPGKVEKPIEAVDVPAPPRKAEKAVELPVPGSSPAPSKKIEKAEKVEKAEKPSEPVPAPTGNKLAAPDLSAPAVPVEEPKKVVVPPPVDAIPAAVEAPLKAVDPLVIDAFTDLGSADAEDLPAGHKEVIAVFFYPEGKTEALETVHKKFQEVIKKHKLKFRLKRIHDESFSFKGKINYAHIADVCKDRKVPVAIVIGPPPESLVPEQDFHDPLTVALDAHGVSLQLVSWSEIKKDYRYLNLALDIALVRTK